MRNVSELIKNNVDKVSEFFVQNLPHFVLVSNNKYKINVDCVNNDCDKGRHQTKAVLNLDFNKYYCYKCGKNLSLYNYCKHLKIEDKFLELLSELSNNTLVEIKQAITKPEVKSKEEKIFESDIVTEYIKAHGFLPINKIKLAYDYALKRTFGNKELIKDWYCDNQYIYVPTTYKNEVTGLVGRLYLDVDAPRYNAKLINREALMTYNFDNVVNNFNDTIYLTEGMFDTMAVNYAFGDNVAMALMGKSHYKEIINELKKYITEETTICICLDSISKDSEIYKSNITIAEYCKQFFSNTFIIELEDGDPNEIVETCGTFELRNQLVNNRTSLFKYKLKYSGGFCF